VAPFEVEGALALIEPIKEDARDSYLGSVAAALAASDPERALAIVGRIRGESSTPQSVKVGIAYALGEKGQFDEAERVIAGMKEYAATKYQAEAYAWLGVVAAPRDQGRAERYLERALALPFGQAHQFDSWTYFGGGAGAAAWVALCARRAGYSDMVEAVAWVLAARPADANADPSMEAQSQTIAAAILALTDPGAARQILRDLEARSGLRPAELAKLADRRWLMAWVLADPKHAEELFDAELAALEGQREADLDLTGLLKMAEILVQPRHRREGFLRREIGATWYPGFEE
jgi:hypothetical protein